jgi:probable addiction module antidote protein
MPKRTGDFNEWHLEKLSDPTIAANYLDTVWNNSRDLFLDAVKDVIQARQVTAVAKQVGVQRESLYRSFSSVVGNPTNAIMQSVLSALGVEFSGLRPIGTHGATDHQPRSLRTRGRHTRRRTSGTKYQQLKLTFSQAVPIPQATSVSTVTRIEQHGRGVSGVTNVVSQVKILPGFFSQQQYDAGAVTNAAR